MSLTGQLEIVTRPNPVGPHSRQEQSVSFGLDADQGEHIPTHRGHPGVKMFRAQPVADGRAGPDRTRRPVGTDEIHVHVRPLVGGHLMRYSYVVRMMTSGRLVARWLWAQLGHFTA